MGKLLVFLISINITYIYKVKLMNNNFSDSKYSKITDRYLHSAKIF